MMLTARSEKSTVDPAIAWEIRFLSPPCWYADETLPLPIQLDDVEDFNESSYQEMTTSKGRLRNKRVVPTMLNAVKLQPFRGGLDYRIGLLRKNITSNLRSNAHSSLDT
jgi:hypothetical protein